MKTQKDSQRDSERLSLRIDGQSRNIKGTTARLTPQQQRNVVLYFETELALRKKRDVVLQELAITYKVSTKTIERTIKRVGNEVQRRRSRMEKDHYRLVAATAGLLYDNAVKLQNSLNLPHSLHGERWEYTIIGAVRQRAVLYASPGSYNPLADLFPRHWYVNAVAAADVLAHLNQDFPELRIDDWWAIRKDNITPALMDALRQLAIRESYKPSAGCATCRAITEGPEQPFLV